MTIEQKAFIARVGAMAQPDMKKSGILASLTIAQAILESGWGKSGLTIKGNALFGIKAGSGWTGKVYSTNTKECYDGKTFTATTGTFRAYGSWEESIADHSRFLTGLSRYKAVIDETDYTKACYAIHAAGYASDPNYAHKLIGLIQQYGLTAYDEGGAAVSGFLKPDKTRNISVAGVTLKINEKIIPNDLRAAKDVASWCKKGQLMKPCSKLNDGTGKPRGICVHNTGDIKVATGTNAAEQYCRASYNGNMAGVMVHFYVWRDEIWQLLGLNERGWHAADGSSRRAGQRDGQKIGGNLDTVAIEAIGKDQKTEDTTALLCAWLCQEFGLDPTKDIYQHNYFYPAKNCPQYIRPHWSQFLTQITEYTEGKEINAPTQPIMERTEQITEANEHTVKAGDTLWSLAVRYLGSGQRWPEIQKANDGIDPKKLRIGMTLIIPKK